MESRLLDKIQFKLKQPIREVMAGFNEMAFHTRIGFGIVVDEDGHCVGVVTDGDIRRRIVNGLSLETPVEEVVNREFVFVRPDHSDHQILRIFDQHIRHIPVIDENRRLVNLLQFNDFNASSRIEQRVIRSRVPVRISFTGGGTDMSYYFRSRTGYVLTSTINKYCYASIRVRQDNRIRLISKDYNKEVEYDGLNQLIYGDSLDLIKACVKVMEPDFGFDLETYSEIEPGTGLGGSSAVSAAVIGALNHFRNEKSLDRYRLADLAYQVERIELGVSGGWQDQYATVFGGLNFIEFRQNEILVIPLRICEDILLELQFNLLLFRFGKSRQSGTIHKDQGQNFKDSARSLTLQYDRLAELTLKSKDALVKGSLKHFGELMHEAWEIKKSFSNKISNSHIDNLYTTAITAGALGGKVLGAGGEGYLLFYCDPSSQPSVIEALESKGARRENFDFVPTGLKTWTAACYDN